MVLKSTRSSQSPDLWNQLSERVAERQDITLLDEYWDDGLNSSFYEDVDCYLSPHRSEGYGLTIAHAIAHGKYVVATAYGGPQDFMMPGNTGQVSYSMVRVGTNPIYPSTAVWAEPDVQHGAHLLREAFENPEHTSAKAKRASEWAMETFTLNRAVDFICERTSHKYR